MNRTLIIIIAIALLYLIKDKLPLPLFRLPGDFKWKAQGLQISFPFATCILVSLIVSIISSLINRR